MVRFKTLRLLVLVSVSLQTDLSAFAQTTSLSPADWARKLADATEKENNWYYEFYPQLDKVDSGTAFNFINQLGSSSKAKGNYFVARFNCIKSTVLYMKNASPPFAFTNEPVKKEIINLMEEAKQR